jgi:endonuclease G, mitochondrial
MADGGSSLGGPSAMGNVAGRVKESQLAILRRSAKRWSERTASREAGLAKIQRDGVGAADSLKRQIEYATRLQRAHRGSGFRANEAILGTNDLVPFAPSEASRAAARPVARIVELHGSGYQPTGFATGFLIAASGLLLTNWHVFPKEEHAYGCGANFRHAEDEHGLVEGQYFELDAKRFYVSHEELDFAIVAVKPIGTKDESLASVGWTRLIEATGKIVTGEPVNIVQHPGGGPRRYAIKNNVLVDILPAGFIHYEADTAPGSSGSPVFSPRWEIVGLHHSGIPRVDTATGQPLTRTGEPYDSDRHSLSDIDWIANEGTRASFIVEALRRTRLEDPAQAALLADLIASTADPLGAESSRSPGAEDVVTTDWSNAMNRQFLISGPTTIHLHSAPMPTATPVPLMQSPSPVSPAARSALAEKVLVFDPEYAAREGYDPSFLGVEVPAPTVQGESASRLYSVGAYREFYETYRDVPEVDTTGRDASDAFILDYHHYSLAFDTHYFMCAWTASNCDYRPEMRQDLRKRREFGGEDWRLDPRVPPTLQLADKDVYAPARRVDRGHIVRREDNAWGAAGQATEYANSDTYHFTNCVPQHEAFNQENPQNRDRNDPFRYADLGVRGIWGAFESAVEEQLKEGGGQAIIFAGPVLDDFVDVRDWATGVVSTPKRFWKVVVVPKSRSRHPALAAYGYIFDQTDVVKRFGLDFRERLDLPAFDGLRTPLAKITDATGVVFAEIVRAAEHAMP